MLFRSGAALCFVLLSYRRLPFSDGFRFGAGKTPAPYWSAGDARGGVPRHGSYLRSDEIIRLLLCWAPARAPKTAPGSWLVSAVWSVQEVLQLLGAGRMARRRHRLHITRFALRAKLAHFVVPALPTGPASLGSRGDPENCARQLVSLCCLISSGSPSASWSGKDGAVFSGPLPRSGGCAHG